VWPLEQTAAVLSGRVCPLSRTAPLRKLEPKSPAQEPGDELHKRGAPVSPWRETAPRQRRFCAYRGTAPATPYCSGSCMVKSIHRQKS
jgi:hypothetical protein